MRERARAGWWNEASRRWMALVRFPDGSRRRSSVLRERMPRSTYRSSGSPVCQLVVVHLRVRIAGLVASLAGRFSLDWARHRRAAGRVELLLELWHVLVWVIPLTFASSSLVSVDAMPTSVRWLAEINPVTSVADATRALMLGDPAGTAVVRSAAWIVALLLVFVPLAVRAYQRR